MVLISTKILLFTLMRFLSIPILSQAVFGALGPNNDVNDPLNDPDVLEFLTRVQGSRPTSYPPSPSPPRERNYENRHRVPVDIRAALAAEEFFAGTNELDNPLGLSSSLISHLSSSEIATNISSRDSRASAAEPEPEALESLDETSVPIWTGRPPLPPITPINGWHTPSSRAQTPSSGSNNFLGSRKLFCRETTNRPTSGCSGASTSEVRAGSSAAASSWQALSPSSPAALSEEFYDDDDVEDSLAMRVAELERMRASAASPRDRRVIEEDRRLNRFDRSRSRDLSPDAAPRHAVERPVTGLGFFPVLQEALVEPQEGPREADPEPSVSRVDDFLRQPRVSRALGGQLTRARSAPQHPLPALRLARPVRLLPSRGLAVGQAEPGAEPPVVEWINPREAEEEYLARARNEARVGRLAEESPLGSTPTNGGLSSAGRRTGEQGFTSQVDQLWANGLRRSSSAGTLRRANSREGLTSNSGGLRANRFTSSASMSFQTLNPNSGGGGTTTTRPSSAGGRTRGAATRTTGVAVFPSSSQPVRGRRVGSFTRNSVTQLAAGGLQAAERLRLPVIGRSSSGTTTNGSELPIRPRRGMSPSQRGRQREQSSLNVQNLVFGNINFLA